MALVVFASAIGAAPASADLKCDPERVSAFGGKITAKQIQTTRVGCRPAKRLLRRYFRLVLATSKRKTDALSGDRGRAVESGGGDAR